MNRRSWSHCAQSLCSAIGRSPVLRMVMPALWQMRNGICRLNSQDSLLYMWIVAKSLGVDNAPGVSLLRQSGQCLYVPYLEDLPCLPADLAAVGWFSENASDQSIRPEKHWQDIGGRKAGLINY